MMSSDFLIVLPARYGSTRLPGKPLADIHGKPMIVRSWENAANQAAGALIIVATDDQVVADVCFRHRVPVMLTDPHHDTGTDRVAEVARTFQRPYVINYQPDEPLLEDGVIKTIMHHVWSTGEVCCGMARIQNPADITNDSVGKVVVGHGGSCLYISRHPIPYHSRQYWTQVCVYGFTNEALQQFAEAGQTEAELCEGIEMLRWLEIGRPLRMVEVPGERLAVDTPGDLDRVRAEFLRRHS